MKKGFIAEIKKAFGKADYSGLTSPGFAAPGTKECWFSENGDVLIIHVDPEMSESQYAKVERTVRISLGSYDRLALIFDDWTYLLEFVRVLSPKEAERLHALGLNGGLKTKREADISGIGKKPQPIDYCALEAAGLCLEAQNVAKAYAVLWVEMAPALKTLSNGGVLEGIEMRGELNLRWLLKGDYFDESDPELDMPITLRNCKIGSLTAFSIYFSKPVRFEGCSFGRIRLMSDNFGEGLECIDCNLLDKFAFEMGGTYKRSPAIVFKNVTFRKPASFFDCVFTGPFIMEGARFLAGTDLLRPVVKGDDVAGWGATFKVKPVFKNVSGKLDVNVQRIFEAEHSN